MNPPSHSGIPLRREGRAGGPQPGLLDLQVNGFAGVDFQADELSREDLLRAVQGLQRAGCTRFLLTLITDEWEKLLAKIRRLRRLREGLEAAGDQPERPGTSEPGRARRPGRAGAAALGTARPTDDPFPGTRLPCTPPSPAGTSKARFSRANPRTTGRTIRP